MSSTPPADGEASYRFRTSLEWTGHEARHDVHATGKAPIALSASPEFGGERDRYNPEELLVAALSSCHMLWYLHLCSIAGIAVTSYQDRAEAVMVVDRAGNGRIAEVTLRPVVGVASRRDVDRAGAMHDKAHARCFIARSVAFPVLRFAEIRAAEHERS